MSAFWRIRFQDLKSDSYHSSQNAVLFRINHHPLCFAAAHDMNEAFISRLWNISLRYQPMVVGNRTVSRNCFPSYHLCLYLPFTAPALHSLAISSYLQNSTPSHSFNHLIILSTIPTTCAIPLQSGCNVNGNTKPPPSSFPPDPFSHSHSKRSFHICSMRRTST